MTTRSEMDKSSEGTKYAGGVSALIAGGLAAILGSACCLGPLILVTIGVSGIWIGNLAQLQPYHWFFVGIALMAQFLAYRKIFRPAQSCKAEKICARPQVRVAYKIMFWVVFTLVVIALAYPYILPLFY